uniref:Cysteine desulfurase putative n=1 Tax=Albugo laibachii Nc14 TaxID=890382 RepID=F0WTC5_9STRA|nr:cysteine desulfurase putative [Albugo laibachii Nc14]|eukprot:CCA24615.1 cysteine desulfurase putative [Albugo laibachii Nc14]
MIHSYITSEILGRDILFETPFGRKHLLYADYTASGRCLASVENVIREKVLPVLSEQRSSYEPLRQSRNLENDARKLIAEAVNADVYSATAQDELLFTGPGATSAIIHLVRILGMDFAPKKSRRQSAGRPMVFIGPFEHHSNILPWRESSAELVYIPHDKSGRVDTDALRHELQIHVNKPLKIGVFSVASNVTGVLTDVDSITSLLHEFGAFAFWDYATAAPYTIIDMNPVSTCGGDVSKDAIYFSGHKFVGGPGSPGVLVVKKKLLHRLTGKNGIKMPKEQLHPDWMPQDETSEGPYSAIGVIRLSLAFRIKKKIGPARIMEVEEAIVKKIRFSLSKNKRIVVLGSKIALQLPIFSFLIRCGNLFLHFNFVCALLNDLFGIQTRGGCACAGPHASKLLGVNKHDLKMFLVALEHGCIILKPGFTRFCIPYFMTQDEIDYILKAIHFVADHGWKFMPQYDFCIRTGEWSHKSIQLASDKYSHLTQFNPLVPVKRSEPEDNMNENRSSVRTARERNLALAKQLASESLETAQRAAPIECEKISGEFFISRWFVYPDEAIQFGILGDRDKNLEPLIGPIRPMRYLTEIQKPYGDGTGSEHQRHGANAVLIDRWRHWVSRFHH